MITLDTPRLRLRPFAPADAPGILALDSNSEVLRYVPMPLMTSLEQAAKVVENVQAQYARNGVGRWAVERKSDGAFLGWCGLKFVDDATINGRTNYHDIGYRLLPAYWGQGYTSEAAAASLRYGFEELRLPVLNATVMQATRPRSGCWKSSVSGAQRHLSGTARRGTGTSRRITCRRKRASFSAVSTRYPTHSRP